jgi:hypothetical protein
LPSCLLSGKRLMMNWLPRNSQRVMPVPLARGLIVHSASQLRLPGAAFVS